MDARDASSDGVTGMQVLERRPALMAYELYQTRRKDTGHARKFSHEPQPFRRRPLREHGFPRGRVGADKFELQSPLQIRGAPLEPAWK